MSAVVSFIWGWGRGGGRRGSGARGEGEVMGVGGFGGYADGVMVRVELSLTVPITNSLAFLFTVLGEWFAEKKTISRGEHVLQPPLHCPIPSPEMRSEC